MNKKNYLSALVAIFAMISVMILSSCSHDDFYYNEEKAEQAVNDKYAVAFEKAFGKVGPNVDWGFSSKNASTRALTRAVGTYAQYKGNMQPSISFPSDCNSSNFLAEVPQGVNKLPADGGGPGSYYIDASTTKVSTWAGASKIYVTGTVDLSTGDTNAADPRFAPDYRSEIFLLEGATLKLGRVSAQNFKGTIYIAQGATLASDESLMINGDSKVYNHGLIKVPYFEVNTSSFLYNVGTLTANTVYASSNGSRIVNDDTINSVDVTVDAGAVQNNNEWIVSDLTKINSNNSGWVNNGHWKTKDYAYVGGSENVINNCYLWVTNDFEMNISSVKGAFKIDSGGGVLAKNFYGGRDTSTGAISGPFKIVMGENAVFVVEETAQFESGRGEIDNDKYAYGIFGPLTGGYAVFQAKNIVRVASIANTWGAVTYRGHLYVSAETHFAQGDDGMASHKFIFEQDGFSIADNIYAAGFKSGKPNINIPQTPCSPGFKGGDPLYRVIAEDLSASEAGDFDFNDVVFDVVKAEGGSTTLKLIAAGGIYKLTVGGQEVHELFEQQAKADGTYPMVNTGAGVTHDPVEFKVNGTYNTPEQIKTIQIIVYKPGFENGIELYARTGEPACKILVDDSFGVIPERKNIANEYKKFTNYVQGSFVDDFWWK